MQEKHFGDPWTCSTGAGLLERKQGAAPSPSASSTTRGSAPSSVEEVQPPAASPQPRLSGQEAGTQRSRTSLCVIHPRAGPLLRLHLGPHCCYREEAQEALRAVMGPPPTQSLPFPRLDSSPSGSHLGSYCTSLSRGISLLLVPPFWDLGEQPVVPWGDWKTSPFSLLGISICLAVP